MCRTVELMMVATYLMVVLVITGCRHAGTVAYPAASPQHITSKSAALFHDEAQHAGLTLRWGPRDPTKLTILDMMGFGCAFLDYDGDNRLDILLVARDHVELYRNRGDGTFENATDRAFPHAPRLPYLMGCSVCDYDGDGRPDIFVTGHGRTILYHNEGDGTFKDVTKGSGLEARGPEDWTTSAAWADIDGSGRPSLYVCRYLNFGLSDKQLCDYDALDNTTIKMACAPTEYRAQQGSLYRYEGNGKFHDITKEAGLAQAHGGGLGCMFCDFNNDGRMDLFIANDQRPEDLYVNTGNFHFKNVSEASGVEYDLNGKFIAGMGVDWGDYKKEGRFDLLIGTYSNQPKCLFHNEGGNLFIDDAAASGMSAPSLSALTFGAKFADIGNNGLLDIILVNGHVDSMAERVDSTAAYRESCILFQNAGEGHFADISNEAGDDFTRKVVGRGIAIGDYDGDGRLDVLAVDAEGKPMLLHNDGPVNHYLDIRCLGVNGKSDALGARIMVSIAKSSQIGEMRASGSYLSTDAPGVHFGLGEAKYADRIVIRWPNGKISRFTEVAADHAYVVRYADESLKLVR